MAAVGFEPTPPKRLVPKTSALDRSATLPVYNTNYNISLKINEKNRVQKKIEYDYFMNNNCQKLLLTL